MFLSPSASDMYLSPSTSQFIGRNVTPKTSPSGNAGVSGCWHGRGRGWSEALCFEGCICDRPHYVVLCHCCGFHCNGRLRIQCKNHPNVNFLMDIDHCPKCKAQQFMMSECRVEDFPRPADVFPPVVKQKQIVNYKTGCCNKQKTPEGCQHHGRV